jgi:hypothetical protein
MILVLVKLKVGSGEGDHIRQKIRRLGLFGVLALDIFVNHGSRIDDEERFYFRGDRYGTDRRFIELIWESISQSQFIRFI